MEQEKMEWAAFSRKDGRKGIRNKVMVVYTVECSKFVAEEIVRRAEDSEVEVIGFEGCTDNEYAIRLLAALIRHPNVGGIIAVGLGCEYVQPERLAQIASKEDKPSEWFFIQEVGGTDSGIRYGLDLVHRMKKELKQVPKVQMGMSDLVIGAECGGSDYTSGLAGNVVVGHFFDWLVDHGGTAVFEEILEAVGLDGLLCDRAADEIVRAEIQETYEKALNYCKAVRQYSVSPGNFAGGLTTIEEKSMGAVVKSGSRKIQGVLKVGQNPQQGGLWLLDTTPDPYWMQFGISNPNDNEGLLALISCGCHVTFLVTGRGNVVGSAIAPVIKITGNSKTYRRMIEDMDFDAGRVLSGEISQEKAMLELADLVMGTAAGRKTKSELLGHKEYFIPYKYQHKNKITRRCDRYENGDAHGEYQQ